MSRSFYAAPAVDPNALTSGESSIPRHMTPSSLTLTSGRLYLTYFTARKTESVGNFRLLVAGTAAGATPTLVRAGLWEVAASGALTLVSSIANDTALLAATFTPYTRAATPAYTKVAGQRYAAGLLVVSAAAMPAIPALTFTSGGSEFGLAPRLSAYVGGQTDLPSSIATGSLTDNAQLLYLAVTP